MCSDLRISQINLKEKGLTAIVKPFLYYSSLIHSLYHLLHRGRSALDAMPGDGIFDQIPPDSQRKRIIIKITMHLNGQRINQFAAKHIYGWINQYFSNSFVKRQQCIVNDLCYLLYIFLIQGLGQIFVNKIIFNIIHSSSLPVMAMETPLSCAT